MRERIATLRAEYADLHREVLDRFARGEREGGALWRLQIREQDIVRELSALGVGPYESDGDFLRQARAH